MLKMHYILKIDIVIEKKVQQVNNIKAFNHAASMLASVPYQSQTFLDRLWDSPVIVSGRWCMILVMQNCWLTYPLTRWLLPLALH